MGLRGMILCFSHADNPRGIASPAEGGSSLLPKRKCSDRHSACGPPAAQGPLPRLRRRTAARHSPTQRVRPWGTVRPASERRFGERFKERALLWFGYC